MSVLRQIEKQIETNRETTGRGEVPESKETSNVEGRSRAFSGFTFSTLVLGDVRGGRCRRGDLRKRQHKS